MLEQLRDKLLCELVFIFHDERVTIIGPPDEVGVLSIIQETLSKVSTAGFKAKTEKITWPASARMAVSASSSTELPFWQSALFVSIRPDYHPRRFLDAAHFLVPSIAHRSSLRGLGLERQLDCQVSERAD